MEWTEIIKENFVVISCFTGVLGYFATNFKELKREIRESSEKQDKKYDAFRKVVQDSSERHEARCDKLYEMFIELLKEKA